MSGGGKAHTCAETRVSGSGGTHPDAGMRATGGNVGVFAEAGA